MTEKKFLNELANGKIDVIQLLLDLLKKHEIDYCVIGGLAVNAYAEPVASLDLDIVIAVGVTDKFFSEFKEIFKIEVFSHSIILSHSQSDLRIQLQTDERYQLFIKRSVEKNIFGYPLNVAKLEDVLQGKLWAHEDTSMRQSKRQKDLADILRLVENHSNLTEYLPPNIRSFIS